jgi:hypothetical protein
MGGGVVEAHPSSSVRSPSVIAHCIDILSCMLLPVQSKQQATRRCRRLDPPPVRS